MNITTHGQRRDLILRSYRIPRKLDSAMQKYSVEHGCSLSDIVREAIREHIGVAVKDSKRRRP